MGKNTDAFSFESPFTHQIEKYPLPERFKMPKLDTYDGSKDPLDHLHQYMTHMQLYCPSDEMKCKVFPAFLAGRACQWFRNIPARSIPDFKTLARMFVHAFIMARPFGKNTDAFSFESPFTHQIENYPRPERFKMPKLDPYDGSKDPLDHLHQYMAHMRLDCLCDEMKCKAFPVFLTGRAREWFRKIPARSIPDFKTLGSMFVHAFITARPFQRNATHLLTIKQKNDETVLQYLKRFGAESLLVQDAGEHVLHSVDVLLLLS